MAYLDNIQSQPSTTIPQDSKKWISHTINIVPEIHPTARSFHKDLTSSDIDPEASHPIQTSENDASVVQCISHPFWRLRRRVGFMPSGRVFIPDLAVKSESQDDIKDDSIRVDVRESSLRGCLQVRITWEVINIMVRLGRAYLTFGIVISTRRRGRVGGTTIWRIIIRGHGTYMKWSNDGTIYLSVTRVFSITRTLCAKVTPTSQSFFLSTLDVVPYLCLLLDSLYRRQPDPTYWQPLIRAEPVH